MCFCAFECVCPCMGVDVLCECVCVHQCVVVSRIMCMGVYFICVYGYM